MPDPKPTVTPREEARRAGFTSDQADALGALATQHRLNPVFLRAALHAAKGKTDPVAAVRGYVAAGRVAIDVQPVPRAGTPTAKAPRRAGAASAPQDVLGSLAALAREVCRAGGRP